MNSSVPKQFLELAGKPVLFHAVRNVQALQDVVCVVIVLPAGHIPWARGILGSECWNIRLEYAAGGATRQESVWRGVIQTPADAGLILVHDAVRPLCDPETMQRVVDAAWLRGAAVPGLPATDTIQRVSLRGRILATPPREELYAIQTPQCFRSEILRAALERAQRTGYLGTDESSVVRWAGHSVAVVPGSPLNIKITRPVDLEIAELLIKGQSAQESEAEVQGGRRSMIRIGQGIDYHRLVDGRKLILGGIDIPFEKGLEGHSDADVLTHAICDALLGAAALGDIGRHFPDNNPAHRGRFSLEFLREVRKLVEQAGWLVWNVDATILAQRPRLSPFMEAMRRNIGECLGLEMDAVSVKATTTEGMNAEGQGEGISAQAVALLGKR
jgi:2-C-methyl-D-erythritol 4-phosphate cytidylyltransferase/2-C-methyl-D-erythritol 2,4-cyclodiphosphate synthase